MVKNFIAVFIFVVCILNNFLCTPIFAQNISTPVISGNTENLPKVAIVIDDFGGYCRFGVDEMLALNCPLTCAVMPKLPYTHKDAENAHKNGKQVILHMPMEAYKPLPESWYGKVYIKNCDTCETAKNLVCECLKDVPYAVGMNIHIGSGVSTNKTLMKAIINTAKEQNIYFLDSGTTPKTVCPCVAKEVGVECLTRFEFLEKTGKRSYTFAKEKLQNAINHAKKYGNTLVIGHVGSQGGQETVKAIKDMLPVFEKERIKLVFASELLKNCPCKN